MNNLRVISFNAADLATISASSTAGALVAANLQTNRKGEVHRSTGNSVTHTLTWASPEVVSGVCYPATNLTPLATLRVQAYLGASMLYDSGTVWACPGPVADEWDWLSPIQGRHAEWRAAINANSFGQGILSKAMAWLDMPRSITSLVITLTDTSNPAGYIDCARIICGNHWAPTYNADYGATHGVDDTAETARADSGDVVARPGTKHDVLQLSLKYLPPADRTRLADILRTSGQGRPVLLSLYPDGADAPLAQDNLIYGWRKNSPFAIDFFEAHSTQVVMEGW